jgi:hypothetical protein
MKHTTLEEMQQVASVVAEQPTPPPMSRSERLEHWARLLERQPDRLLATLHGTEYQTGETQAAMRCDNSPISVAFADPALRAQGLKDETYGEAKKFFELSDWQLHEIVCYCHFGGSMTSGVAARRVRSTIDPHPGILNRMRQAIVG